MAKRLAVQVARWTSTICSQLRLLDNQGSLDSYELDYLGCWRVGKARLLPIADTLFHIVTLIVPLYIHL